MKNRILIEEALAELCNEYGEPEKMIERARKLITDFLASQTAANVGKFDLSKFVAKDDLRPVMTGIYNDPEGYKVATDAHTLCALRSDVSGFEGQVISPKGEVISQEYQKYPNWRVVCPAYIGDGTEFLEVKNPIDIKRVAELWKSAKIEAKASGEVVVFDYEYSGGETIRLKGEYLVKFITFLNAYPEAKVYIYDDTRPIYAIDKDGNRCLLVPLKKELSSWYKEKIVNI